MKNMLFIWAGVETDNEKKSGKNDKKKKNKKDKKERRKSSGRYSSDSGQE